MGIERRPVRGLFNGGLLLLVRAVIGGRGGQPTVTHRSVTGEPYVAMTNGGIKLEGEPFPVFAGSRAAAVKGYIRACQHYAHTQRGYGYAVLYWREHPSIHKHDDGTWTVFSRLLVSEKLVLAEAKRAAA